MEIKQINEALKAVLCESPTITTVEDKTPKNYWEERGQGDEGDERITVYSYKDLFIKVTRTTDSYGDTEQITGIAFVSPVVKQVNTYE